MRTVLNRFDSTERVVVGADPGGRDYALPLAVGAGIALTSAFVAWKFVQSGLYIAGAATAIGGLFLAPKIAVGVSDVQSAT